MSPEQKLYERAFEIIEAFGADVRRWPEEERVEIEDFVAVTPELQNHLRRQALLDQQLAQVVVTPRLNPEAVAKQIVVHPQRIDSTERLQLLFERLTESMTNTVWKPLVAASFVFAIGVGAGSIALSPVEDWTEMERSGFALLGEE